jgi:L-amino acid N-acyltransferase YncA
MIRSAQVEDAAQLCEIYNHYVLNTPITFEEEAVLIEDMEERVRETTASLPWLVWEENEIVLGYCHASKWKGRCAYRYSAESTVYLRPDARGRGIGTALYRDLLARLKEKGFHTVVGGIALPNRASVTLHEKLGCEKIAQFREVGRKFGRWIDVGYWQLLLNS